MKPDKIIPKRISRAIMEYDLISGGDRVLLALSGGKDSMAMARFLVSMAPSFKWPFKVEAVHVTTPWEGTDLPDWIRGTCDNWELPLTLLPLEDMGAGKGAGMGAEKNPDCVSCSRLRRKALLNFAVSEGFRSIALGHHMEDCLTTYLMNLVYNGRADGLLPRRTYETGGEPVYLIRPLILLQEEVIAKWAAANQAVGPSPDCPWESPESRRKEMREKLEILTEASVEKKRNFYRAAASAAASGATHFR